ncbi:hypothetical protein [Pseudomonas sp.]|uniref:hypothetical protein n=1 Tax=Pseudomonas sp. TaxID=306 RepID=UPI002731BFB0|nr:hypothetical protein [Pseudomonas sp.]MDP2244054.1 hypothetical protein [Pseudomonas sp.]
MAKTNAEACKDSRDKAAAERERLGIVIRKWPIPAGINTQLESVRKAHGFKDWRELLETVIQRLHDATPADAARFLAVSRHQFTPTEEMLRQVAEYRPPPEPE